MEAIELIQLISRGEDSRTQFKRDVTNEVSLASEFVAFSNAEGGRILIGVDDHGNITGITLDNIRRLNILISNASEHVRPPINPITENVGTDRGLVMVVTIRKGISKPYQDNQGVYWMKSGADKRRSSREEIQRIFQSGHLIHADEVPVTGTTTDDIDMDHFSEFFGRQFNKPLAHVLDEDEGVTTSRVLNNLGLAKEETINLAGLLLFGRQPQRYCPAFIVKAISYFGNDPSGIQYRDSDDFTGCLRDLYEGTFSFLTRNLCRLQRKNDGFNAEGDLEVPVVAIQELVVNMLLHRDYFISAPCRVMIFDNRIELISPGSLPNNLTVEHIQNGVSVIRNPLIASFATQELPYRGMGTGIRRALNEVPELKLKSDPNQNLFTACIPREAILKDR